MSRLVVVWMMPPLLSPIEGKSLLTICWRVGWTEPCQGRPALALSPIVGAAGHDVLGCTSPGEA
jgi:hypothetical protein